MDDRTKIASEQLAALVIGGASAGWDQSNDQLTNEAIELTDLLLSKLEATAPTPSELQSSSPAPITPEWNRLDRCCPQINEACHVIVWGEETGQIESIDRLYWDGGMWQTSDGDCALGGGVSASRIYWFPLHRLPNLDEAIRHSFINFIESH